ncbi:Helix-turn-helix of DDE superfamily endonuclease [Methylomagnum ishizawai]|uniref:Helix-turn-helix of DDE superfamily endonuclease n=1 Tax=Methylomagnum ishizawai TaxID=1760988 RepID=A0A1Y6CVT6_9GAMM|nr:transposase family protein [Methylomagnum ishizawai]SMF94758.1 Helix-turn-helix of DDE superfamily endonuclease [Methylomagnum ishizawai]
MIFSSLDDIGNDRVCKALTGLTKDQFKHLLLSFESTYRDQYGGPSLDAPSPAFPGYLSSFGHRLFFVLYYLKNYPSYDVLGYLFGFSGGHAFDHLETLLPILQASLAHLKTLPERSVKTVEALDRLLEKQPTIIIDGTERATLRPQDKSQQEQRYSGKKKHHGVNNLVIANPAKKILFISSTVPGSVHDYALFKTEFPPALPWFQKQLIEVDLGFQGIKNDYPHARAIQIPHKKPKKSKANPDPKLTPTQKKHNRKLAKTRVAVEHAIGGMKCLHSLVHRSRNHLAHLLDTFIYIGAGLWNFKLSLKTIG